MPQALRHRWSRCIPPFAQAFSPFIVGLFIGNVIYLIGIYFVGVRTHRINFFSNIYLIIPLLAGANGLLRLSKVGKDNVPIRGTYRVAIAWFSIGLVLWSIGCAIGMVYSLNFNQTVPFVWWGDAFFAMCFLCWTAGVIRIYNLAGLNFLKEVRDVIPLFIVVLGAAIGLIFKVIPLAKTLSVQSSSYDVLTFAANLFFPAIDLFNMSLLVTLLPGPAKKQLSSQLRRPFGTITLGYFFLCVASYTFCLTNGLPADSRFAYYNGGLTDAAFAIAFAILAVGLSQISVEHKST